MNFIGRRKRPKMGVREPSKVRSPGHLQWLRGHICAVNTLACNGRIEAHHVRETIDGEAGGIGLKPDDSCAVPLCQFHHQSLHIGGTKTFQELHKIDLAAIAAAMWKRSPYRLKKEQAT